jgi:hypothetical protein
MAANLSDVLEQKERTLALLEVSQTLNSLWELELELQTIRLRSPNPQSDLRLIADRRKALLDALHL